MQIKIPNFKDAYAAAKQIKDTTAALRERRADLAGQRAQLDAHNEALYRQPLRRADAKALALLSIDRWAMEFMHGWKPVLNDYVFPRGDRPLPIDAQEQAVRAGKAKVMRAEIEVERIEKGLQTPHDAGPNWRPQVSHEQLGEARNALRMAQRDFDSIERPGTINLEERTFRPHAGAITVVDAVMVIERGAHTSMLGSSGGGGFGDAACIDHFRNIVSGSLIPDAPIHARGNQALAIKGLCFFIGDAIKAKIAAHFDEVVGGSAEEETQLLPLEKCRAQIAENNTRIAQIEREVDDIDSQLALMHKAVNG